MAFHFDARGDSSSDEGADIDLSSWTTGAARAAASAVMNRAPVAPMMPSKAQIIESNEESDVEEVVPTNQRTSTSTQQSPASPALGFQPISESSGRRNGQSTYNLDSDASPERDGSFMDVDDVKMRPKKRRIKADNALVIYISDTEIARAKKSRYIDLTAGNDRVRRVLREAQDEDGTILYNVQFDDFHTEEITFDELIDYENGQEALHDFNNNTPSEDDEISLPKRRGPRGKQKNTARMSNSRPTRRTTQRVGFVSTIDNVEGSDVDMSDDDEDLTSSKFAGRKRKRQDTSQYMDDPEPEDDEEEDGSDDEISRPTRSSHRTSKPAASSRSLRARPASTGLSEDDDSDGIPFLQSDLPEMRERRRRKGEQGATRHSGRSTRHQGGMVEVEMDDIYRSESNEPRQPAKPKPTSVKEIFQELPRNDEFRMRHNQYCESCGAGTNMAKLINCQGCSMVYHKQCLGHRSGREHLVTKVGEEDFVLQCRRCVASPRKKDRTAPDHGKCTECRQHGAACRPFRSRKTPNQEMREREENDGVVPVYDVPTELVNNVDNVLFRCTGCSRAFHYEHLPSRSDYEIIEAEVDPEQRFREYSRDWKCKDCAEMPAKVSGIIAWKPADEDSYDPALGFDGMEEEDKVYLVRWDGMSYFRARWMPGPWVWGVTLHSMRKAFAKRDDSQHPKMRTEDAIPEDYLRTDIVLDVKFTSYVDIRTEEIDKARIREIDKALIKYKGLNYEDAVWETPPSPDDGERWSDFVVAYNDWVAGRYVRQPKAAALKTRLEKARKEDFRNLEKTAQPDSMEGGKLMEYQIQGLNWLYYKWFTQKNAVLADEMGLGKTIQIIGFLATLVQDHNCFPFLVVVPNSTCPNWRREIKRWAPGLRVVAYYGSRESKDLAYKYELYPENSKDLRCHVVVTSYDTAADENARKFFRNVPWQGLVVDEGQRLKNDKNILYSALGALKVPLKILLTGTPLQNNQRELFNLLHFLDDSFDAAALEQEYLELDQAKIEQMHDMIRPFFLRRTKAQVLTFLPPMAQIILPVSMSIVQKKLYRSILAKNPDLMKAIFSTESANLKQGERASLSNILMQLRKCLCHPFVYNKSIEDKHVDLAASHRNLVDASSKLKLLELLLPKLKERGHRVLIFSQFLDMLDIVEDFMDGMQMRYQRLDGSISSLQKQKRIDEFNAPDSPLFGFLLSTRAGGVGINLASADTVIIMDPDFNPHQDIQALSRAHRIGQQKKVLCFQLVTRASAEERIMQIGRKKLALDHVLIQEMDADDAEQADLVSVLRHGASELFDDNGDQDINYDSLGVERLLDRSHMEDTKAGQDKTAETQFSFARVWANDSAALQDASFADTAEAAPDPGVWANILKERERVAAEEAAAKAEAFGRGRRARANNIDYTGETGDDADGVPFISHKRRKKQREGADSDTDFQADDSDGDEDEQGEQDLDAGELADLEKRSTKPGLGKNDLPTFKRAIVPLPRPTDDPQANTITDQALPPPETNGFTPPASVTCRACQKYHPVGSCPLKLAGVEHCNLCGIAHYGHSRVCPHIQSETQVRTMLEALKYSNEPEHLINEAKRYLRGLKGSLVQFKKHKEAKENAAREAYAAQAQFHGGQGQNHQAGSAYGVPDWQNSTY